MTEEQTEHSKINGMSWKPLLLCETPVQLLHLRDAEFDESRNGWQGWVTTQHAEAHRDKRIIGICQDGVDD
jgi:hypothetical protein